MSSYSLAAKYLAPYLSIAALLPLLPGCSLSGGACTADIRNAVVITVKDEQGNLAEDATVVFSVDGGTETEARCNPMVIGSSCKNWAAGVELAGTYIIKATSADGMKHATTTVEVDEDECHVQTEEVTLTLK